MSQQGGKLNKERKSTNIGTYNIKCLGSLEVTHNASPVTAINYWRTVLKESEDLVILGVTFDSKMTFEKHLRSVSRAASQRLCILRKSGECSCKIGPWEMLSGFCLARLEYCSAVWCLAADTHLKLLHRADSRVLPGS